MDLFNTNPYPRHKEHYYHPKMFPPLLPNLYTPFLGNLDLTFFKTD